MPATSEKKRRFMGMELSKKRAGKPMDVQMSESQLSDFSKKPIAKKKKPVAPPPKSKFQMMDEMDSPV
jgi:hypothetical protein